MHVSFDANGHGSGFLIRNFFPRVNASEGRSYTGAIWAIPSTTYSQSINCRNRCASGLATNEETKGNCTAFLFLYQNASGAVRVAVDDAVADDFRASIYML